MASKFSLRDLMNSKSTADTEAQGRRAAILSPGSDGNWDIRQIPLEQIVPNKHNEYGIRDIEELAESIEEVGLLHNLVVREQESGKYELISGERRFRALRHLYNSGHDEWKTAPCKIESESGDAMAELQLLIANIQTRDLTDYEKVYQAQRAKQLLLDMKKSGHKFKGRTRENVALLLGVSTAQIGRIESIYNHLCPDFMEEFKGGTIGISTAYELSCLDRVEQETAFNAYKQKGGKLKVKDVKPAGPEQEPQPEDLPLPGQMDFDGKTVGEEKPEPLLKPDTATAPVPALSTKQKATVPPVLPSKPQNNVVILNTQEQKPTVHELKIWPEYFKATAAGKKPWEYRLNDRDYKQGDILRLREYDPKTNNYTGAVLEVSVLYLLHGPVSGIPEGYVVMTTAVV